MKFHEIIAIGPIFLHQVATKPSWSIADLSRIIYTLDNDQVCIAGGSGVGEWFTLANLEGDQTITGVKTFSDLPLLTADPTEDNHAVRKSFLVSHTAGAYVDLVSDQLAIGGQKGFLLNPTVSGEPIQELELANKGYIDDNFVDITTEQTIDGIKSFMEIPFGPNLNPSTDNQLTRKRYVDDLVSASLASVEVSGSDTPTVKITSTDSTANYLASKLVAGSGVELVTVGAAGANQTLRISLTPTATGAGDGEIFVSGNDTTPGYLAAKLVAGAGIELEVGNPAADEYVEISLTPGGSYRTVTVDFEYAVGAAEYGSTYTMPAPDTAKAKDISRNNTGMTAWCCYEHPGTWSYTPSEDLIALPNFNTIFPRSVPYDSETGQQETLSYPTVAMLQQTMSWKTYKNCTTYNNGSPDGVLSDWDFFSIGYRGGTGAVAYERPVGAYQLYFPYTTAGQTYSNNVYTPGLYQYNGSADYYSFGYFGDTGYRPTTSPVGWTGGLQSVSLVAPQWILGISPAPTIDNIFDTSYGIYAVAGAYQQQMGSYGTTAAKLVAGQPYTFKLRSIWGYRQVQGYGTAAAYWFDSTADRKASYRPTSVGDYTPHDVWELYQGQTHKFFVEFTPRSVFPSVFNV